MKTLFVVDDQNLNLYLAQEVLSKDYRVFTLPSAAAMFKLLEKIIPDMILLDIQMPGMDGFEALIRLKANKQYSDIPVIFFTSRNDAVTRASGLEMGAVDFIQKPFSEPVLLSLVKTHLENDKYFRIGTGRHQKRNTANAANLLMDTVQDAGPSKIAG